MHTTNAVMYLQCWESHMYKVIHQLGVVDLSIVIIKCLLLDAFKK